METPEQVVVDDEKAEDTATEKRAASAKLEVIPEADDELGYRLDPATGVIIWRQ